MKIKELRLGNLLLRNNKIETVNRLSTTRINKNIASEYQGIGITEPTLAEFGFEDRGVGLWLVEEEFELIWDGLSLFVLVGNDGEIDTRTKYVHQLQNLYYTLMEKEL